MLKSLVAFWVSFVMMFVNFVPGFVPPENKNDVKTYPFVFVHGFLGWGEDEGIDEDLSYWGATSCNLMKNLTKEGYECLDASVGPFSSNWDRACELYAQLMGTTVDYGEAHSKMHNHLRYGRTYEEPLIEDWGKTDKNGLVNKINLLGHSFGGNTVRLLAGLLSEGDVTEIATSSPDDISPLFTGGKGDWVNTVVTICSPNNGTTLDYIAEKLGMVKTLEYLLFGYAGIMGRSIANGYVDFHLEQFGLTYVPGQKSSSKTVWDAIDTIMEQTYDCVEYDLSPEGAKELNDRIELDDNVYYFSYAFQTTYKSLFDEENEVPLPSTLAILQPFATMMGQYSFNDYSSFEIDSSWLPNDGLVNVVSALHPFDDPAKDYDANNITTGIWNVMPLSTGDHGNAIGIGISEKATMDYYHGMLDMINSLPVTN